MCFCHCLGGFFARLYHNLVFSIDNVPGYTAYVKWNNTFNNIQLELSVKRIVFEDEQLSI